MKKGRKREKIMFTLGFEPTHREKSIFKSSALLTELQRLDYENIGQMSALLSNKYLRVDFGVFGTVLPANDLGNRL